MSVMKAPVGAHFCSHFEGGGQLCFGTMIASYCYQKGLLTASGTIIHLDGTLLCKCLLGTHSVAALGCTGRVRSGGRQK